MKTLDEVIEAQERCETYPNCHFCYLHSGPMCEWIRDALHYLKTYRENQQTYIENSRKAEEARERYLEAVKNCELAENKYRKLYEETSQNLRNTSQITCPKCHSEFVILPEANNALTWEELHTMEGKPVWATFDNENGTWYIAKVYDDEVVLYEWGQEFGERISGAWDYTPKRWQAYRKERIDGLSA